MKKGLSTLLMLLILISGYSQNATYKYLAAYYHPEKNDSVKNDIKRNFYYNVHGAYEKIVKKETLNSAKRLEDISDGYPKNWVNNYVSAEIRTKQNGKTKSAKSSNEILTAEQKNILRTTDIGADIEIYVKYKTLNSATGDPSVRDMRFTLTVIPDIEAQYPTGFNGMQKYLWDNAINKFEEVSSKTIGQGKVRFTVNEEGETIDAQIKTSSGDYKIDRLIIDAIDKMPKWKPAQNSNGTKVRQDFEFSMGVDGC